MGKGVNPDLFVNDGSFLEKFKQLQQTSVEKEVTEESKSGTTTGSIQSIKPIVIANKRPLEIKSSDMKKSSSSGSSQGKLAFSLKQKSKIVSAPVKLAEDDEDQGEPESGISEFGKRRKLGQLDGSKSESDKGDAPVPPSDPTVKNAADKLARFVAKNGRHFEDVTRQKNPGDTPFKFLFDTSCSDYKYYEYQLLEEGKDQNKANDFQTALHECSDTTNCKASNTSQKVPILKNSNFQTPASALYGADENALTFASSTGKPSTHGESSGPRSSDPIAVMEYYMKKAAQEERNRQPRYSNDEMPPPASLQAVPSRKGHHMGDFIPQEELEKFFANCNDATALKAAKETASRSRIQSDNVGHRLLSKMGWKEGEGLGSAKAGRADPVIAGNVKLNNLGVGAENPGEVTPDDDIYEQYKKRMMLGYKYRPNPLNNPRKSYY